MDILMCFCLENFVTVIIFELFISLKYLLYPQDFFFFLYKPKIKKIDLKVEMVINRDKVKSTIGI